MDIAEFGKTREGIEAHLYTYTDKSGMKISVTDYGASLVSVMVPDYRGNMVDVVLGFDNVSGYERQYQCVGSVIGRTCNRIEHAKFKIDGRKYKLTRNFGPHNIHGGRKGFSRQFFQCSPLENGIECTYLSVDGEENYPGNLSVSFRYTVENGDTLKLEYVCTTDKDTLCNLTNHSYFNLNGCDSGTTLDQNIQLFSDYFTEADKYAFPNGNILPVEGTDMDLRQIGKISRNLDSDYSQIKWCGGYDTNYAINGYDGSDVPKKVAYAYSDETKIAMEVESTMPGVQYYTGNSLDDAPVGKHGRQMHKHDGFCLETQYYPNAMAHDNFVQPILRVGDTYHHITTYRFTIKDC